MMPKSPLLQVILALSFLGIQLANPAHGSEPQIQWSEDLLATMQEAQQTGKPVLIHFYGDHCPPCRMLETKAFKDRQLIEAITENLLAVKINAERDTKTAAKFRVNRWPTDVYLHPDGQEIYRNISAQDPAAYEKTVLKVAEKNMRIFGAQRPKRSEQSRSELLAMQDSVPSPSQIPSLPSLPTLAPVSLKLTGEQANSVSVRLTGDESVSESETLPVSPVSVARVRLSEAVVQSIDTADVAVDTDIEEKTGLSLSSLIAESDQVSMVVETPAPSLIATAELDTATPNESEVEPNPSDADTASRQPQSVDAALPTSIAMNGFCPVSLGMAINASQSGASPSPAWVQGKSEFAVRHRGRVYHCASEESLAKFLEKPDQYAPVLSGCDLVEYSKSGKWIDGDCRFGFIDKETGRIFLFSSSLNCQEFAQNCESYSSMVGKPNGR